MANLVANVARISGIATARLGKGTSSSSARLRAARVYRSAISFRDARQFVSSGANYYSRLGGSAPGL